MLKEKYIGLSKSLLDEIIKGVDNGKYIKDYTDIIESKTALKNCNTNMVNNFLNDIETAYVNNFIEISRVYPKFDEKVDSVSRYFFLMEKLKEKAK